MDEDGQEEEEEKRNHRWTTEEWQVWNQDNRHEQDDDYYRNWDNRCKSYDIATPREEAQEERMLKAICGTLKKGHEAILLTIDQQM